MSGTKTEPREPTLRELDDLLDGLGGGDDAVVAWRRDHPLTPGWARAMLRRHEADPSTQDLGYRRETVRAASEQLRMQADAFRRCADALVAGDPLRVPAGNPLGSCCAEVRTICEDSAELVALMRDPAAKADVQRENEALASMLRRSADACDRAAEVLDASRMRLHGRAYALLIAKLVDEEAAARRKRAAEVEATR
jgi:hypothetical protein